LMRTGEVECNLLTLNETFQLSYVPELVARKVEGQEKSTLDGAEFDFYAKEVQRLTADLEEAQQASRLPEAPTGQAALNDLLLRLRLGDHA
jgi:uncharacterized protein